MFAIFDYQRACCPSEATFPEPISKRAWETLIEIKLMERADFDIVADPAVVAVVTTADEAGYVC